MGKLHLLYWTVRMPARFLQGEIISRFQTSKYTSLTRPSKTKGTRRFVQKTFRKSTPKENGLPTIMNHNSLNPLETAWCQTIVDSIPDLFSFLQNKTRNAMSPTINICTINERYTIKADWKSTEKSIHVCYQNTANFNVELSYFKPVT